MTVAALVGAGGLTLLSSPALAGGPSGQGAPPERGSGLKGPLGSGGGNLIDHGDVVLSSSTAVPVWWGPSFPTDMVSGTTAFLKGLSASSYLAIAGQYMPGRTATTSLGRSYQDTATPPPAHSPKVSAIVAEVAGVVGAANLDPDAVYLVFTSNFPSGASFCAWHSSGVVDGVTVNVAYLPNVASVAACASPALTQSQGNPYPAATQSNTDDTAHEFMEAITDPTGAGWYDRSGYEIADKCQTVYTPVLLGKTAWDIQQEWSNFDSGCVSQAP